MAVVSFPPPGWLETSPVPTCVPGSDDFRPSFRLASISVSAASSGRVYPNRLPLEDEI